MGLCHFQGKRQNTNKGINIKFGAQRDHNKLKLTIMYLFQRSSSAQSIVYASLFDCLKTINNLLVI